MSFIRWNEEPLSVIPNSSTDMPIIRFSTYSRPPRHQFNGHLQTILPALFRRVAVSYERERLDLPDGDFLDLDWIDQGARRLVILSHGLEGSSGRHYIVGTARLFADHGWDVLAWNCRSCSGEMNRSFRLYHHGDIEDIGRVIDHALHTKDYERVVLVGYSMGGSMTLKYLGVHGRQLPAAICRAVAFSTPCDLEASAATLDWPGNRIYRRRFLKNLRRKIERKALEHPGKLDLTAFDRIRVWRDFDEYFSAPMNGYADAAEFYRQSSAVHFMSGIRVPTLVVNAQNDPILQPACSPAGLAARHPHLFLETPALGGHVGFSLPRRRHTWSEQRALEFCSN